jgi:hypothetical protein
MKDKRVAHLKKAVKIIEALGDEARAAKSIPADTLQTAEGKRLLREVEHSKKDYLKELRKIEKAIREARPSSPTSGEKKDRTALRKFATLKMIRMMKSTK